MFSTTKTAVGRLIVQNTSQGLFLESQINGLPNSSMRHQLTSEQADNLARDLQRARGEGGKS
jgi:hypothetical protein